MKEENKKLKFFEHGSEKIDFSKLENLLDLDASKPITVSKDFNIALKIVIEKDIDFLSKKIEQIIKQIENVLASNNIAVGNLNYDINNMDNLISYMDKVISDVIVSKASYKTGIFSTKKKEKKQKSSSLEECINLLTKYQNEIIVIKNEYDGLKDKKDLLSQIGDDENEEKEIVDPLERTINFYLNKQKEE